MTPKCTESTPALTRVSATAASCLAVPRPCLTAPDWNHVLVLVAGARRTWHHSGVTYFWGRLQCYFGRYHETINRVRGDAWCCIFSS
jgi:hypothetical protein